MNHLFFARHGRDVHQSAFQIPDGYRATVSTPTFTAVARLSGSLLWKLVIWKIIFTFSGTIRQFKLCQITNDIGLPVHYGFVFPKYFRFPCMGINDLQIGSLWTSPSHRKLGLASAGVRKLLESIPDDGRNIWYIVASSNGSSIAVARRNGFALIGTSPDHNRLLKTYALDQATIGNAEVSPEPGKEEPN